jgi:phage recombination protein Bet
MAHQNVPGGMPVLDAAAKQRILRKNRYAHLSEDQYELLIATCQELRLNPWRDHVWIAHRPTDGRSEMIVQCKLSALRDIAVSTGDYAYQIGPFWCDESGPWKRGWRPKYPPTLARVGVVRKGQTRAFWGVAKWEESALYLDDGKTLTDAWARMPSFMLAKVAEAMALRKAFPNELSGVYTPDEIALKPTPPRAAAPATYTEDTPTSDFLFQKRLVSEFELANAAERAAVIRRMEQRFAGLRKLDARQFYATVLNELRAEAARQRSGS